MEGTSGDHDQAVEAQGPSSTGRRENRKRSRSAAEVPDLDADRKAKAIKSRKSRKVDLGNGGKIEGKLLKNLQDMNSELKDWKEIASKLGITGHDFYDDFKEKSVTFPSRTRKTEKLLTLFERLDEMTEMRKRLKDKILEKVRSLDEGNLEQNSSNAINNLRFLTEDELEPLQCINDKVNLSVQQSVISAEQSVKNGSLLQEIRKILLEIQNAKAAKAPESLEPFWVDLQNPTEAEPPPNLEDAPEVETQAAPTGFGYAVMYDHLQKVIKD